jgi:ferredoxin
MKYKLILIVAFILGMFPLMTFAAPSRVVALQIKKQPANVTTTTTVGSKKIELEIEATGGTKPYTYTWYQGSVGDTTTVIGNRSKLSTTVAIGSYSVWARVSDATNATVDTSAVSVAVAAFVAPTPVPLRITSQSRDMAYNITAANKVIELPKPAPMGSLKVNVDKCTLCLSCVSACPASALQDNPELPQLRFIEKNCVQCGLCATTCPEDAIDLVPRFLRTPERKQAQVLNQSQPYGCVKCGKPFGTLKAIEAMLGKLAGHSMFQGAALERLKMCGDCRVIDIYSNADEAKIANIPPKG